MKRSPKKVQRVVVHDLATMNKGLHRPHAHGSHSIGAPPQEKKERELIRGSIKVSQSKPYPDAKPGSISEKRLHPKRLTIGGAVDYHVFSIKLRWMVEIMQPFGGQVFARRRRKLAKLRLRAGAPVLVEVPGKKIMAWSP